MLVQGACFEVMDASVAPNVLRRVADQVESDSPFELRRRSAASATTTTETRCEQLYELARKAQEQMFERASDAQHWSPVATSARTPDGQKVLTVCVTSLRMDSACWGMYKGISALSLIITTAACELEDALAQQDGVDVKLVHDALRGLYEGIGRARSCQTYQIRYADSVSNLAASEAAQGPSGAPPSRARVQTCLDSTRQEMSRYMIIVQPGPAQRAHTRSIRLILHSRMRL